MTVITEAEARTKWCPLARGQNWDDRRSEDGSFTANRLQSGDPIAACLCIGSRCMAWRFDPVATFTKVEHGGVVESLGYCGAFGRVEP